MFSERFDRVSKIDIETVDSPDDFKIVSKYNQEIPHNADQPTAT